jgi:RNA polymerase sigma-70 factor, ECF subfamily
MEKMILAETPIASSCDTETLDFDTLVSTHGRFVLNIAYSVLRNSEDAEDVVQETFFRAFRSGGLDKIKHMRAWLGRIAWRLALNRRRRRSGSQLRVESDDILRTLPSHETGAEELLIRQERANLLEHILLSLPRDLRETFLLLAVEGITSRDAAEIIGIPDSSVRDRLYRSRKLMKEKLAALVEKSHERRRTGKGIG